ncbi:MAG: accessory gene regulator B family protein [Candidatus Cohnella colombiensis]|uniref:Accessory gene regulator B family protein n=1 Tax=Candidatus Cohnella colombiensis TaxID=3121368 RepID=A0AA95EVS4_9BACL|nr:MAG: accessory gene regulator B family protein [Cohnella sp.]
MIETISSKMAHSIKRANPEHPASFEVLKYALASVINLVGTVLLAVLLAILLDHVVGTLVALVSFGMLRSVSGGYHMNSSVHCMIVTALAANAIPYIQLSSTVILIMTVVSVILAMLFAPSNIEKSSRIPARYYPLLKLIATLIISSNLLFNSSVAATCFLLQSSFLIPFSKKRR